MNETLYYITDTYGSYYTVNAQNKIVATNDPSQAVKFTMAKANKLLQTMIKPMQRYQYILREAENEEITGSVKRIADVRESDCYETRFDVEEIDWKYYIEDLINFCSDLRQYQVNLNYLLSQVDKEICDIMHYIEFNSLDAANGYKMYKMLRDCRMRRRKIKDDMEMVDASLQALGDQTLLEKLKICLKRMESLDYRQYHPRVLTELFEEAC